MACHIVCWAQDTSVLRLQPFSMAIVTCRLQAGYVHWLTAVPYAVKHTLYFQSCPKCALLGQSGFSRLGTNCDYFH